ncbi:MAG: hypothetical protein M4579_006134 [Chaenotheca gracillima]|nr:MAG: hypothetical protein M4579_006134 [Chaenotheca gracillima]
MPPRRQTRSTARGNAQSTLSFSNKVTKPNASSAVKKKDPSSDSVKGAIEVEDVRRSVPVTSDLAIREQATEGELEKPEQDEEDEEEEDDDEDEEEEVDARPVPEFLKSEQESKAQNISDAQVKRYWRERENERKAPRVHQEGLSVHEKILRHFDLSSQYGPCIGIARRARWTRASSLHLDPPIEILAVLLKEDAKGAENEAKMERAYVDELLGGKAGIVE